MQSSTFSLRLRQYGNKNRHSIIDVDKQTNTFTTIDALGRHRKIERGFCEEKIILIGWDFDL